MVGRFSVRPRIQDLNADFDAQFASSSDSEEQEKGEGASWKALPNDEHIRAEELLTASTSRYTRRATLSGGGTDTDPDVDPELAWPAAASVSRSAAPAIRSSREPATATPESIQEAEDRKLRTKARAVRFTSDTVDPVEHEQQHRDQSGRRVSLESGLQRRSRTLICMANALHQTRPSESQSQRPLSRFAQRKAAERSASIARAAADEDEGALSPPASSGGLIGGVQERRPLQAGLVQGRSQPELDAQRLAKTAPCPALAHTDTLTDAEVWLDEKGKPMSAFRKAKMMQRGERPSSTGPVHSASSTPQQALSRQSPAPSPNTTSPTVAAPSASPSGPDYSRDPGGGADPSDISTLLSDASAENDAKLRAMSAEEIAEEQRSVETLFGPEIVEMLRKRAAASASSQSSVVSQTDVATRQLATHTAGGQEQVTGERSRDDGSQIGSPEDIRLRFFPELAKGGNAAVQWMTELDPSSSRASSQTLAQPAASERRFDFQGHAISSHSRPDTYSEGLHHHGDNQSTPGYTPAELFHLGRSTVAAQRSLALSVLGRIAVQYPVVVADSAAADPTSDGSIAQALEEIDFRAHSATLASWLLDDRQRSVAVAALVCLWSCLLSDFAGPNPAEEAQPLLHKIVSPPPHASGSSTIPERKQDWVMTLLSQGLLNALRRAAPQRSHAPSQSEVTCFIEVLGALVVRQPRIAAEIAVDTSLMNVVVGQGVKQQSSVSEIDKDRLQSQLAAIRLVGRLVSFSRDTAHLLLRDGAIDALLRSLVILSDVQQWSATSKAQLYPSEWDVAEEALKVYIALGRYGLFAPLYMRIAPLLAPLQGWCKVIVRAAVSSVSRRQMVFVRTLLELLTVWTLAATDTTDRSEESAVLWIQAKDWGQESFEVLNIFAQCDSAGREPFDAVLLHVAGSAAAHVCAFQCAWKIWETDVPQSASDVAVVYLLQASARELGTLTDDMSLHTQHNTTLLATLQDVARTLLAASSLLQLGNLDKRSTVSQACVPVVGQMHALLDTAYDSVFLTEAARAVGAHGFHRHFVDLCMSAMDTAEPNSAMLALQLLITLQRGESELAHRLTAQVLEAASERSQMSFSPLLMPFFRENLRPARRDPVVAPLRSTPSSMQHCTTLLLTQAESIHNEDDEDEDESVRELDADEVDPMTGKPLWRSRAAGLPLRRDWPLLALDDLLQSAESAAFNRPGNLPDEWNENEEAIVRTSLKLMDVLMDLVLTHSGTESPGAASLSVLPTPSELLFSLMKVFRLEDVQTADGRFSGAATGRDLFRDPSISTLLSRLYGRVSQLAQLRSPRTSPAPTSIVKVDSLETAAARTLPEGVPFFQFYSDLLGLYDALSFGDSNFARAVVAPLAQHYAVDYRRLLWVDYAAALGSIRLRIDQAPTHLTGWLDDFLEPRETDEGLLIAYSQALVNGSVGAREGEESGRDLLLYRIAVHHCAGAIWSDVDSEATPLSQASVSLRGKLTQMLLAPKSKVPALLRRDILLYNRLGGSKHKGELKPLARGDAKVEARLRALREAESGVEAVECAREVLRT